MGVQGLWNILSGVSERKPLKYLSGKRIAVDLSGWVVQAFQCKGLGTCKNPHLRNLFYRVSRLLLDGALPIFVIEGELIPLKINAFKERNHHHPIKHNKNDKIGRSSFDRILSQCHDLLHSLGVPCIKSSGEAEAFCAYLYTQGIVDGVITEDNDAFLYGADCVYREFTIDPTDPHINVYNLKSEKNKLHLNRRQMIALALLLGCDYIKGVPGIGKEAALQLLSELQEHDLLKRFEEWKEKAESELFPGYEVNVKKVSHCSRCDHPGSQSKHKNNGCEFCDSNITCYLSSESNSCTCAWHESNKISSKRKTELKVYAAVKKVPDFPNTKVIQEYLTFTDKIPDEDELQWKCPDLFEFQEKAYSYWSWTPKSSFEKCLPIITSWQQFKIPLSVSVDKSYLLFEPNKIVKEKTVKGDDCLLVLWKALEDIDLPLEEEEICTTEYLDRFSKAYPEMSKEFFAALKTNKSSPTSKAKPKTKLSKTLDQCQKVMSIPTSNSTSKALEISNFFESNISPPSYELPRRFSELSLIDRIKIIRKQHHNIQPNLNSSNCEKSDTLSSRLNCFSSEHKNKEFNEVNTPKNALSDSVCLKFDDSNDSFLEILNKPSVLKKLYDSFEMKDEKCKIFTSSPFCVLPTKVVYESPLKVINKHYSEIDTSRDSFVDILDQHNIPENKDFNHHDLETDISTDSFLEVLNQHNFSEKINDSSQLSGLLNISSPLKFEIDCIKSGASSFFDNVCLSSKDLEDSFYQLLRPSFSEKMNDSPRLSVLLKDNLNISSPLKTEINSKNSASNFLNNDPCMCPNDLEDSFLDILSQQNFSILDPKSPKKSVLLNNDSFKSDDLEDSFLKIISQQNLSILDPKSPKKSVLLNNDCFKSDDLEDSFLKYLSQKNFLNFGSKHSKNNL